MDCDVDSGFFSQGPSRIRVRLYCMDSAKVLRQGQGVDAGVCPYVHDKGDADSRLYASVEIAFRALHQFRLAPQRCLHIEQVLRGFGEQSVPVSRMEGRVESCDDETILWKTPGNIDE